VNGAVPSPEWFGWTAVTLVILYGWLVVRRNRRIARPPVLDSDGAPLPSGNLVLSDGEEVDYLALRPGGPDEQSAPAVVLVPGADGMKETFRYQVPALASRYPVLAASLRRRVPPDATLDRLVDDVSELIEAAGMTGPVVLLGQSLGGAIAMRFAVRFPDRVAALVLSNTLAHVGYDHLGLNRTLLAPAAMATTRYLPTALSRWMARLWSRLEVWIYDASPGRERVIDYALWTGPRTVRSSVSRARVRLLKRMDLRGQLPAIRAPVLVLKGPRDHYVPPSWSHEIVSLVPGAEYREVAGTGHCSHLSMPASFNGTMLGWLRERLDREVVDAAQPAASIDERGGK
jgi:pimeloyl-ACP methyl ester carboxylesterase